jgi:hypothetical protein
MADPELGIDDSSEPLAEAPETERRVFTQSFDLAVQTVLEQWGASTLLLPDIQREYVWSDSRASRLVESLLLNIPIPLLYFAETADSKWEIFDGHQRVQSVVRFVENDLVLRGLDVLTHLNKKKWRDLTTQEQRHFMRRMLRAVVITADSHPSMKYEIFERLNTGSIVLNAQELRNSLYRGALNDLLHELARAEPLRVCIGTKEPRRRMVDEELVLRFFALRAQLAKYRPPLKKYLNNYMNDVPDNNEHLEVLRDVFLSTATAVAKTLGALAFRQLDPHGKALDRAPNRALFDAQMLAFSWNATPVDQIDRRAVIDSMATLFQDMTFLDASTLATGDRARTILRIRLMIQALEGAGLHVDAPSVVRATA